MSEQLSKQEQVVNLVKEGKYTRKEIKEMVGCTANVFATYLSAMRNAANFTGVDICPIEEEIEVDGKIKKVMTVTSFKAAEAAKAERAAASGRASTKTPAERLEAADRRVERTSSALDSAKERYEANEDNRELELRYEKAKIEAELAEIEQARAKALVEAQESEADVEADDAAAAEETEEELM